MFVPKHFQVEDKAEIDRFISENGFGILVSQLDGETMATHLPVHRVSDDHMQAHLAKANPQWQQLDGQRVLLVLAGPHDYVSPTWYEGPGVPTWNYQAVHIYATATCFTEADKLRDLVMALSHSYEDSRSNPWPGEFDERMLNAIVGIDLKIEDIQCKYKLSQNRPAVDQKQVSDELEKAGNLQLARAMRAHNQLD